MDTIGNLLTSIRNAEMAGLTKASVPYSNQSASLLGILRSEGYVESFESTEGEKRRITVLLPQPVVRHSYKRLSKPGRRLYSAVAAIKPVLRGYGFVVLSTSQGMMTGKQARKARLGGELICEVS